eukprot:194279-Chlamydomonas_euryale.AAC.1
MVADSGLFNRLHEAENGASVLVAHACRKVGRGIVMRTDRRGLCVGLSASPCGRMGPALCGPHGRHPTPWLRSAESRIGS